MLLWLAARQASSGGHPDMRVTRRAPASSSRGPYIRLNSYAGPQTEGVAVGTLMGTAEVVGGTGTYTFTLDSNPDGKFSNNGTNGANLRTAGTWANDTGTREYSVRLKADNGAGSVLYRWVYIPVLAVLGELTADIPATLITGTPANGTITGAHDVNEVITISGPSGLTLNSAARTWAWSGVGAIATTTYQLTGTHPQATNSPRASTAVDVEIADAGSTPAGALTFNDNTPLAFSDGNYLELAA